MKRRIVERININTQEHGMLLWKISNLNYEEGLKLGRELGSIYESYHSKLNELAEIVGVYQQTAKKIRESQPGSHTAGFPKEAYQ